MVHASKIHTSHNQLGSHESMSVSLLHVWMPQAKSKVYSLHESRSEMHESRSEIGREGAPLPHRRIIDALARDGVSQPHVRSVDLRP